MLKKALLYLCFFALMPFYAHAAEEIDMQKLTALVDKNHGKVVMLNFFATWCPPCKVEIPELVKLRQTYPEDKLLIIGLSVDDDPAVVEPFLQQTGVNYPVYMAGKSITDAYKISSVPHNAFFAPDGQLVISEPGMAETSVLKRVVNDLQKNN